MQDNPLVEFLKRYGPSAGEDGPVLLMEEVFGVELDPWQERVLRAFGRGERRISIRSCHGPGKTAVASWLVWVMLLTRFPQKTVATAPTKDQLDDALIMEIKTWGRKLPPQLQELFEVKSRRIELIAAPESSFFSARTSRAEKPEALQGVHSDHVLLIADEASGVPEPVFEAAAGSMSGHNATTLLISNPVRTAGLFFDTHNKLKDMWVTAHVSHEDSLRVTDDFVEDIARRYGDDSNAYRVRCLGEFPRSDDDVLIPYEFVSSAQLRDIFLDPHLPEVWGLDVARFGGDSNVLVRRTHRAVQPEIAIWGGIDLMATAGKVKKLYDETQVDKRPRSILVDEIGMGSGVVDRLRELNLPVRGINVAETAMDPEHYRNARAELWWKAREWLARKNVVLPSPKRGADLRTDPAERLANELVIPKYTHTSSGKMQLESKADIKKRGFKSPNVADAFVLTFAEDMSTLVYGSSVESRNWNEPQIRALPMV